MLGFGWQGRLGLDKTLPGAGQIILERSTFRVQGKHHIILVY